MLDSLQDVEKSILIGPAIYHGNVAIFSGQFLLLFLVTMLANSITAHLYMCSTRWLSSSRDPMPLAFYVIQVAHVSTDGLCLVDP